MNIDSTLVTRINCIFIYAITYSYSFLTECNFTEIKAINIFNVKFSKLIELNKCNILNIYTNIMIEFSNLDFLIIVNSNFSNIYLLDD